MGINFDLTDLQAFHAVVELGSFRRAAEAISIPQPALSRQIDKLGSAPGVPLLEHITRNVILTIVGRVFARSTEQLLDDFGIVLPGIRDVPSSRLGQMTVACVSSMAYYLLPNLVVNYHRRLPCIRVKPLDISANEALGTAINGRADLGLSFAGSREPEIELKTLLQEQFVAACQRDYPPIHKKRMIWKELYTHEYVSTGKTSGNHLLLGQVLLAVAPRVPNVCETRHVMTMLGLAEAGLGVVTVPSMAISGRDHPILTSVPLVEPVVRRRMGIMKRRGWVLTPAAEEFHQMVIDIKRNSVTMGDA